MHLVQQMVCFVCCVGALVEEYLGSIRVTTSVCLLQIRVLKFTSLRQGVRFLYCTF